MSTMPATAGHSVACCNVPPVVASGYETKGEYEELNGLKTYVTGSKDATKGIFVVYDIFGYFDQTLQGADIMSTGGYRVFMPDWFKGEPCPLEWYPPTTPDLQKKVGDWFSNWAPNETAARIPSFIKAYQEKYPEIKSWAIVGYCWGGKIVSLVTSGEENPFGIGVECHPAYVDASEAAKIKVPMMLLASEDEPEKDVKAFEAALTVPKHVEIFGDQVHGWMAARADLSNSRVKEEYTRAYKTVLDFFGANWK